MKIIISKKENINNNRSWQECFISFRMTALKDFYRYIIRDASHHTQFHKQVLLELLILRNASTSSFLWPLFTSMYVQFHWQIYTIWKCTVNWNDINSACVLKLYLLLLLIYILLEICFGNVCCFKRHVTENNYRQILWCLSSSLEQILIQTASLLCLKRQIASESQLRRETVHLNHRAFPIYFFQ